MKCIASAGVRHGRGPGRGRRAGFTYVETMVAMGVLGIVMAGFYRVLVISMQTRQAAHHHYVAVVIANNRIERAKNTPFDDVTLLAEHETPVDALGAPDPQGTFLRSTTVHTDFGGERRVTRLQVTVQPPVIQGRGSRERTSETVSTLLTDYLDP